MYNSPVPIRAKSKYNELRGREIEGMIADGQFIVALDSKVLRLDAWIKFHPGGELAIRHMVGRDATDEVNALHSTEARQRMDAFQIGSVNGRRTNFVPPIQGGHFRHYDGEDVEDTDDLSSEGSSELSSRPSSPIFDSPEEDERHGLRHRKSTSTISSAVNSTPALPDPQSEPRLCVLDARTQQEIMLDKVK